MPILVHGLCFRLDVCGPHALARRGVRERADEAQHTVHIVEVAREAEAYAHDAELAPQGVLKVALRRARVEPRHIWPEVEERRGPARVADTACAQGDALCRGGMFNKREREHLSRRLWALKGPGVGYVRQRGYATFEISKELTERKIMERTEPVSACSPTLLTRRVGTRDRTRATGVPLVS
jgi:hypothetical protein